MNKSEKIENFLIALDIYVRAIADNAAYQAKPHSCEDSMAGCYPPHDAGAVGMYYNGLAETVYKMLEN